MLPSRIRHHPAAGLPRERPPGPGAHRAAAGLRAPRRIWAPHPHNRHLSPQVRLLVDYLAEHLAIPISPPWCGPSADSLITDAPSRCWKADVEAGHRCGDRPPSLATPFASHDLAPASCCRRWPPHPMMSWITHAGPSLLPWLSAPAWHSLTPFVSPQVRAARRLCGGHAAQVPLASTSSVRLPHAGAVDGRSVAAPHRTEDGRTRRANPPHLPLADWSGRLMTPIWRICPQHYLEGSDGESRLLTASCSPATSRTGRRPRLDHDRCRQRRRAQAGQGQTGSCSAPAAPDQLAQVEGERTRHPLPPDARRSSALRRL